jgi:hypothetical protein
MTGSPMNLYIYGGRLICGSRIAMPREADFVAHTPPYQLENGFGEKEWALIIEKVGQLVGKKTLVAGSSKPGVCSGLENCVLRAEENRKKFEERRREKRVNLHRPVWFAETYGDTFAEGRMCDISSGGMGFECGKDRTCPEPGSEIVTRFSIPRYNDDKSYDNVSFSRAASVCRIDDSDMSLRRVAVQFAKPLPFKPAEQMTKRVCANAASPAAV